MLGKEHPLRSNLGQSGGVYESQGRYGEAEPLSKRALKAKERVLGRSIPTLSKA